MMGTRRFLATWDDGTPSIVFRRRLDGRWVSHSTSETWATAGDARAALQSDGWHDLDELLSRPTRAELDAMERALVRSNVEALEHVSCPSPAERATDVERARAEEREACLAAVCAVRGEFGDAEDAGGLEVDGMHFDEDECGFALIGIDAALEAIRARGAK